MADTKNYIVQPQDGGSILISEDVIASIAALAVRGGGRLRPERHRNL